MPDALKHFQIKLNITDDPTNFLKDRLGSVIVPRHLTRVTDVMTSPLIRMLGLSELLIFTVKYMQTVLLTLRVKHELSSQSDTMLIAAVSLAAACSLDLAWVKITVSSAYIWILTSGLNKIGPKCAVTPAVQLANEEHLSPTLVHCFLLFKYDSIQVGALTDELNLVLKVKHYD